MTTMHTTTAPIEPLQGSHAPIPASGRGLLRAMRLALQWRLMLLWLLGLLLPALVASLPVWRMFGAAFDHTVNAAAYARRLDLVALTDVVSLHPQFASALGSGAVVALLLTLLLSPLLTGAAITAARAPAPLGFAALAAGGRDNGRPGERAYHPGYYGAFVLDPDGNNIEAVYHGEAKQSAPYVRVSF